MGAKSGETHIKPGHQKETTMNNLILIAYLSLACDSAPVLMREEPSCSTTSVDARGIPECNGAAAWCISKRCVPLGTAKVGDTCHEKSTFHNEVCQSRLCVNGGCEETAGNQDARCYKESHCKYGFSCVFPSQEENPFDDSIGTCKRSGQHLITQDFSSGAYTNNNMRTEGHSSIPSQKPNQEANSVTNTTSGEEGPELTETCGERNEICGLDEFCDMGYCLTKMDDLPCLQHGDCKSGNCAKNDAA